MKLKAQIQLLLFSFLFVSCLSEKESPQYINWPGFRGTGDSRTSAKSLPVKWSEEENISWEVNLQGYGQSSPVVWGDNVYITSVDGSFKEKLYVYCFSLKSGELNWQKQLKASQKIQNSKMVSRGAPTSAVDEKGVYIFFESGDLAAFTHEGEKVWSRSLTKDYGDFKGNHGLGSSLAQTDHALIILIAHEGPSYLLSIDKKTGNNIWKKGREQEVSWTSPIVSSYKGKNEILISSNGTAAAYDAKSGEQIWYIKGLKKNTVPSPTVFQNLVILGSSEKGWNLALDRESKGEVNKDEIIWKADIPSSSFGSPLVSGDNVYFVSKTGIIYCLKAKTAEIVWKHSLKNSAWSSPIASEDYLYFFDKSGNTTVLKHNDKGPELISSNFYPCDSIVYGVAAVNNAFLVRMGQKLICIKNN